MTQSPQSGQSAPVDAAGNADRVRSAPTASTGSASGGFGGLPRPDTPTDSVPVISDSTVINSGGSRGAAAGTPHAAQAAAARPTTATAGGTPPPASPSASSTGSPGGTRRARARGPRRAQLQLRHVNPWTVLKFSCVLAVALFFVWLIVVGVLYGILDAAGVVDRINDAYTTLKGDGSDAPVTAGVVFGSAAIIGVVNIILFIALSTIGSVVYNLCADLVGGVEVTLSER